MSHSETKAPPPAPPAPESPYATRPYPVAEDPAVTHQKQLADIAQKLERMRVSLGNQLDADALATLQSAVTELASLAGVPVPGLSQPVVDHAAPAPGASAPKR